MKTTNQMKPLARLIAASLAVGSMAGFGAQALAQTAAGTLIKNLATVTYEDENGNTYSAQSNEAVVTVAPVYSAGIEKDNDLTGAPGQTVYFPHTLSNTGNIEDTFNLTSINGGVVYLDENNNGQPDPGETVVYDADPDGNPGTADAISVPVDIPAGGQANLVVALAIPTTATETSPTNPALTTNLMAVPVGGTIVEDTDNNNNDGTSDDTVSVTTGPVLVLTKSSVHEVTPGNADNKITYTLTVKNNGGSDATDVNIVDAFPQVDTNADGVIDANDGAFTLSAVSASGLINTGDIVPGLTDITTITEATDPLGDINFDGDTADVLPSLKFKDAVLAPNTTVTVTYTVTYPKTWAANATVDNAFLAVEGTNTPIPSNTTHDVIPQTYGVDALDTNTGIDLGVNDGGDDDTNTTPIAPAVVGNNDSQLVDVAASGSEVLFKHEITNTANGEDAFNLSIDNVPTAGGFPSGTTFTYWDATGTVQLTDTDNDGVPDTGMLDSGDMTTIMVKAKLPAGIADADPITPPVGGYSATLTATSAFDPASTPASNDTELKLLSIKAPTVDIIINEAITTQPHALADGFNDGGNVNAQIDSVANSPVSLAQGTVNSTVTINLSLANESGNADSYLLSTGTVPTGWSVVFEDTSGSVITTTPLIAGGDTFDYVAKVTISSDPTEALSDSNQTGAVDGYHATVGGPLASGDGTVVSGASDDDDYQVTFAATSTSTSTLSDTVTGAIDVAEEREVVITPNGQNQIQPGGTVDYSHLLENNGNQPESVELTPTNTQSGWTTVVNVDTDNDGVPDTPTTSLVAGDVVYGLPDASGNPVIITVTDTDNDGNPEFELAPGVDVPMTTTVAAPSSAPLGTTDLSTLSVTDFTDPAQPELSSAEDQTTVMIGQVRLEKTASIDVDCDTPTATTNTPFMEIQTTQVEPGQCVVWKLVATNEGTATAKNVVISDAAPAFTDIVAGKLKFCITDTANGNTCTPASVTDLATDADKANADAVTGLVKFGDSTTELIAGQKMIGEFTVKVQ